MVAATLIASATLSTELAVPHSGYMAVGVAQLATLTAILF